MARAGTDRLKLNPPLGRMPVLQFCAPGELQIDPGYQRGMEDEKSQTLVRRIAQHWNWDLCQPLVVARRSGGMLFVIDGQHRLAAAQRRGDIAQLPCVVQDFAHVADEAASFVHLNQQRKPLTKLDLFRAAVASGAPRALEIVAALSAAGLKLAPHSNVATWKPGVVAHIGGIERAWGREGPKAAAVALLALGQGFAGQVQRFGGTLYRGLVAVCAAEIRAQGSFAGDRFAQFVALLHSRTQIEWNGAINLHFAHNPDMFRAEAAEGLMRDEWRKWQGQAAISATAAPVAPRTAGVPVLGAKQPGFGLGAGDWKGDAEWAWCQQCDKRRTREQAGACDSRFCKLRGMA